MLQGGANIQVSSDTKAEKSQYSFLKTNLYSEGGINYVCNIRYHLEVTFIYQEPKTSCLLNQCAWFKDFLK